MAPHYLINDMIDCSFESTMINSSVSFNSQVETNKTNKVFSFQNESLNKSKKNQIVNHSIHGNKSINKESIYNTWPKKREKNKKCTTCNEENVSYNHLTSESDLCIKYRFVKPVVSQNVEHVKEFKNNCCKSQMCTYSNIYSAEPNCSYGQGKLYSKVCSMYSSSSSSFAQKLSNLSDSNKEDILDSDEFSLATTVDGSRSSIFSEDSIFFNEDKMIVKLLKNWESSLNTYESKDWKSSTKFDDITDQFSSKSTLSKLNRNSIIIDSFLPFSFSKRSNDFHSKVISSSQLIQLDRPSCLPPKPFSEQIKHQKEYAKMVQAAQKKDRLQDRQRQKQLEERLKKEECLSHDASIWFNEILPDWEHKKKSKQTYSLWWKGLPSCVRGKVWCLSIGNMLTITMEQYQMCIKKSDDILQMNLENNADSSNNQECSIELIRLDISRTFPHLCIFQQGGPYYEILHRLLRAYVCFRPDIGYVQGMSFIAAVLLLNMDEVDAFICFANLLSWPCHRAFFTLDIQRMRSYYAAYNDLLRTNMPSLWEHFYISCLTPDLYLVDWIYTIFSKSMNLDLACHIWDLFIRDGDDFIFQAALGILHATKDVLKKMDFLHAAQYLTKLPEDLQASVLLKSISEIRMDIGEYTFQDILLFHQNIENCSINI